MFKYKYKFARIVYLETIIEAKTAEEAQDIGLELENDGTIGIDVVTPLENVTVDDVSDYDAYWEVERVL